ncbi:MAG: sulfatase-like hydrolase/transferase [Myxococcales bacterium]|nr:sulfatase-like hydrolase/transferase [Myxococcales bacterium]
MLDSQRAPIARQVVVGFACVLVATVLEATLAGLSEQPPLAAGELLGASVDLFALYLPLGLGLGLISGLVVVALAPVRRLRALGLISLSPRDLFRPRPRGFGRLLLGTVLLGAFAGGVTFSSHTFATRFHEPWLAAGANAAAVVGLAAALGLTFTILAGPATALARRMGPLASRGTFALLAAIGLGVGIWAFVVAFPEFFYTYRPSRVAAGPVMLAVFAVGSMIAAQLERGRPKRVRALRVTALATAGLALLGLGWVATSYGRSNRTRHVVEDRTVGGGAVVRTLIRLTDRDGDGFSFAFGGGDCDDSDPDVYPGAPDPAGDGIDADCFAGDGAPAVAELGDGRFGEVPDALPERPNVLFVSVDALRPDHLGHRGYPRDTSPNIDAFAATAVRFDGTHASSTRSIRSMSSLMTGLYPSQIHYGQELEWTGLDPENETLAEVLAGRGWQTAATIGSGYFERAHGFFQGFREVVQREETSRSAVVDRGLSMMGRLAQREDPWLLWVHLMNVHQPYLGDGHASRFGDELMDQYDEEVALADEQVGRLLEGLEQRGLSDRTIVVLWSDHGEAFGEHGAFGHTTTLYEEELRAVAMIRAPGVAPRVVRERSGLIDLFATVLNLVRRPAPRPVASRSLVPLMTGEADTLGERVLIAEILPDGRFPFDRKCILRGRWKLHWWVREGRVALFDLEADPEERRDRSNEQPEVADELLGLLRAWTSSSSRPEHQRRHAIRSNLLTAPPAHLDHRIDLGFQDAFTLLGCDVDQSDVRPGGLLVVSCYYRVDAVTNRDYQFLLSATVPPDHPRLHHMRSEHYPVGGRYMTSEWRPGEIVRDHVELSLPQELRPGTTLTVSLQLRDGRVVQRFDDGRDRVQIGPPLQVPGGPPARPGSLAPIAPLAPPTVPDPR